MEVNTEMTLEKVVSTMSMVVARMEKMKAENLIGIGNHNQRKTKNHSNKDIDPSLSKLNYDLVNRTENYKTDIENFINENKSTTRAVRKDAVLINEWIITSDRKFFENLSDEEVKKFFVSAKEYFANEFGEENIRYATVHLDESTPHMHMGIVPFDKDKKLSAKRIFNRETLRDIQENLPKYLQEKGFEIERGIEGSERKNLTVPEFKELKAEEKEIERMIEKKKEELKAYTKENKIDKELNIRPLKEMKDVEIKTDEKNLFGINKTKTVKEWTGNIILSKEDYLKMNKAVKQGLESQKKLNDILDIDTYKENIQLKNELKEAYSISNDHEDKIKALQKENIILKVTISDLREELELIYISTRNFIKEHTDDLKAFKDIFKDLVYSVSEKMNLRNKNSHFEREFQKEFINKPKVTLNELKQIAEIKKGNEVMKKEKKYNLTKKRN